MSQTGARPASATAQLYGLRVRSCDAPRPVVTGTPCPVCGSRDAVPRFEVEGVPEPVVVCADCGLGRFEPMLGTERIRSFYPDDYYGEPGTKFQPAVERWVRLVGARHIGFLSRDLPAGGRVLDVGCGRGVSLGPLADRGFETHGVEISAEAVRGADPRAEIRITDDLRQADYPPAHFDQIVIWHVLEHLTDPRATLAEAHRILKPGGRLVVAVPNFSSAQARWSGAAWFHLDLPRHLYHFPLSALERLLRELDFELVSKHHFSLRQNPFGWIQSALNRRSRLPRNGLYTLLHRRSRRETPPFDRPTRARLWLWLLLAIPFALLATVLETIARSGATVHVVAKRPAAMPHA